VVVHGEHCELAILATRKRYPEEISAVPICWLSYFLTNARSNVTASVLNATGVLIMTSIAPSTGHGVGKEGRTVQGWSTCRHLREKSDEAG
jgi:hypothetical protein